MPVPFEHFRDLATADLLILTRKPNEYTSEAIIAATLVLSNRVITDDDRHQADAHFKEIDARKARRLGLKEKFLEILHDTFQPNARLLPERWVPVLLVVYGAILIWNVYRVCYYLYSFPEYYFHRTSRISHLLGNHLEVAYLPAVIYLVFKKEKWGWILLVGFTLLEIYFPLQNLIFYFSFVFHRIGIEFFLISLLFDGSVIWYLWRNEVAAYFGISEKSKKRLFINCTIFSLAFMVLLHVLE